MTVSRDEDKLEGEFGKRRRSPPGLAEFPGVSTSGSSKRARAAWFNRTRGAGTVKLATPRDAASQRVIVKIKPIVHAKVRGRGGAGGLMRHALYVERDGAGRDGDQVQIFDRDLDRADGRAFVERCEHDRRHFRVIISPEHGGELADLKAYTRQLVERVEGDLSTRIDWIAAGHHDTGRPHIHLLLRGRHEDGRDLVMPRAYFSHGFRRRAEEIATRELGPRLDQSMGLELDRVSVRAAKLERWTHLDEVLSGHARASEISIAALPGENRMRNALVQRLNRLEELKLAQRTAPDRWRLDSEIEDKLIRLGDARDRERATARLMARQDRGLEPERTRALEQAHTLQRMQGRLVGFEQMGSNPRGPHLIGLEGIDGKFWTARVARAEDLRGLNGVEPGAVIELDRAKAQLRRSDHTILEIAGETREYSAERHRVTVPTDRETYIQMHVRRLDALHRAGIVDRDGNEVFHLPRDYEAQVLAREGRGGRESARVTLLDPNPLETQARHHGPAWLDRMVVEDKSQLAQEGFGEEARAACKEREATLKSLGLGYDAPDGFTIVADAQHRLRTMERDDLRQTIECETGCIPHFARDGDSVEGLFVRRIHTHERSYALIVHDRTATLAPWHPEMDRALNQFVSGQVDWGQVNGRAFDFNFGRGVEKSITKNLGLDR